VKKITFIGLTILLIIVIIEISFQDYKADKNFTDLTFVPNILGNGFCVFGTVSTITRHRLKFEK
jgi:hypothetical protein